MPARVGKTLWIICSIILLINVFRYRFKYCRNEWNGRSRKIDEMDKDIKIIFITGHNQYMGNAFKVSAFDYLHKPLNKEDLRNTLIRLNAKLVKPVKCLEIYAQEYIRIPYRDMAIVAAILSITTMVATL